MKSNFRFCALFLSIVLVPILDADVTLAPLFRNGAVLQRDKSAPVWGRAEPGEKVRVQFAGQSRETKADATGRWMVSLSPLPASAVPGILTVRGHNELRVTGVLVGEVWLCSGQSNMNWMVKDARNAEQEIASANNPLIHYFGVTNEVSDTPQDDTPGSWRVVGKDNIGDFSAVAYFFGRELQPHLGVPVGIIKATPGGSGIEAWMDGNGLEGDPDWAAILEHRRKALAEFPEKKANYERALDAWNANADIVKKNGGKFTESKPHVPEGPKSRNAPAGLYNSSIHPLIPYAIRGFLWYQGEANASRFHVYRKLFPAMIKQWRHDFREDDLPFIFVQLANFDLANDPTHQRWAFQREAQASALALPNTAMAVIIDIGETATIHPLNKQEVGRRLALLARAHVYGEKLASDSPRLLDVEQVTGAIRVHLSHVRGLILRGSKVTDLEIAGKDKHFHPAEIKIEGGSFLAFSDAVPEPVAVRYLWRNAPEACLFNDAGLPVAPFRSDSW
jgi:sialate O-acetylesterase